MPRSFRSKKSKKNIKELIEGIPEKSLIKHLDIESEIYDERLPFDKSLERLRNAGYERHLRPWEYFNLMIDHFNEKPVYKFNNTIKNIFESADEWFSIAVERKGSNLICYVDPENLIWDIKTDKYVIDGELKYSSKKVLDIKGISSSKLISLDEFDDEFVEYFYSQSFDELPEQIKLGSVILPLEDFLKPLGGYFGIIDPGHSIGQASRGVRIKTDS